MSNRTRRVAVPAVALTVLCSAACFTGIRAIPAAHAQAETPAAAPAQPPTVTGRIDAVTVYRGQALVTRTVPLPAGPGLHEVVVTGLPEHVVPGSLYAEAGPGTPGVQVRSVRFRTRSVTDAVDAPTRDRLVALDAQLQALHDELAALQATQRLAATQLDYLDRLATFAADTSQRDLQHGVLDAATLTELTRFLFDEQRALRDLAHATTLESRDTQTRIDTLTAERRTVAGGRATATREAVVFAFTDTDSTNGDDDANDVGPATLQLRYLVNQATWSPSYTLRHTTDTDTLGVEYQASVTQATGEDWRGVAITLSTVTPSMVANAPTLEPLSIRLVAPNAPGFGGGDPGDFTAVDDFDAYGDNRRVLLEQQRAVAGRRGNVLQNEFAALRELDQQLNDNADQLAVLDLANNVSVTRDQAGNAGRTLDAPTDGLNVSYAIAEPVTMPSRPDAQLIRIAQADLPTQTRRVATPVLTQFVYRQAQAVNDSGTVLLAGPMTAFLDGQFVGHGQLPNVAAGEALTVGLGSDPTLRAQRTLVSRTQQVVGGNRVVTFTYRLSIQNFSDTDAPLQLTDRLPHARAPPAGGRPLITLTDPGQGQALSDDPDYLANDQPRGLLRWDVTVPAHTTGRDRFTLEYTYTLEHDRNLSVQAAD